MVARYAIARNVSLSVVSSRRVLLTLVSTSKYAGPGPAASVSAMLA